MGYAEESGIPYEMGLVKHKYVGRTFIQPVQSIRELGVKMKLSPVRSIVEGKRVVLVDDSIVRESSLELAGSMRKELGRERKPFCLMELATLGARWLRLKGKLEDLEQSEENNACFSPLLQSCPWRPFPAPRPWNPWKT